MMFLFYLKTVTSDSKTLEHLGITESLHISNKKICGSVTLFEFQTFVYFIQSYYINKKFHSRLIKNGLIIGFVVYVSVHKAVGDIDSKGLP